MDGSFTSLHHSIAPALLSLLRCPCCWAGDLTDEVTSLHCRACGSDFPVRGGIPVLIPDVIASDGPMLDWNQARCLMSQAGIEHTPVDLLRVRQLSGQQVRSVRIAERQDPGMEFAWGIAHLPRAMCPGHDVNAQIQLRNDGGLPLPGDGPGRVTLAARWATLNGDPAPESRTTLPVDLAPGRTITAPLVLQVPSQPGRYTLTVHLVQEGVRWLDPAAGPFLIHVRADAADPVLGPPLQSGRVCLSQDVARQVALIGSVSPPDGCEAVRVGTGLLDLQLARVRGDTTPSVCAPSGEVPFASAAFDAVIGRGLMRNCDDPVRALLNIRRTLRFGGVLLLEGERIGPIWPGTEPPDVVAGRRSGLNPQAFSLADIARFTRRAGFRITQWAAAGNELTALLLPEGENA